MDSKHDPAFLEILREEKNITNFLDSFFGFLYRCTDFYVESTPGQRLGFPPGVAEKLVVNALRKWQNVKSHSELSTTVTVPPAIEEVTIACDETSDANKNANAPNVNANKQTSKSKLSKIESTKNEESSTSTCYNGASYENYEWSQSISDLDVLVRIPEKMRSSKDVRVDLSSDELEVAIFEGASNVTEVKDPSWRILVKGQFSFKIKNSESYWCLEPGKHISLHLEKSSERWWDSLLHNEPRIELSKIDCSRNLDEMGESEQMKVEELMWNQKRKLLGQPTSEQIRMEQILQQAWNADGSPFKGTEYDPSVLKFN